MAMIAGKSARYTVEVLPEVTGGFDYVLKDKDGAMMNLTMIGFVDFTVLHVRW